MLMLSRGETETENKSIVNSMSILPGMWFYDWPSHHTKLLGPSLYYSAGIGAYWLWTGNKSDSLTIPYI